MSVKRTPPNKNSPASTNLHSTLSDPTLSSQTLEVGIKDIFVNMGRRTRRRLDDETYEQNTYEDNSLLSAITKLFSEFEYNQNRKLDSINSTVCDISEQNAQIQQSITFFSQRYDELLDRLASTEQENSLLKKQLSSLESRIDFLERNTRSAIVEISNLPSTASENEDTLTENLIAIGTTINQPISRNYIKNIHRMKPKKASTAPGTVIVEFNSINLKNQVLKNSRLYNKQNSKAKLSTTSIKLPGPTIPIYIAESLTSYNKHLYYLARKLQKEGKCESCWSNRGKVYIKKNSDSSPYCINSEKDLTNLILAAK